MSAIETSAASRTLATKLFVYISRPVDGLSSDAMHAMLVHARRHNALDGLHGLLTIDRRGFLQVMEGTSAAVDELLARIGRDPRHCAMQLLMLEPVATPMFSGFADVVLEGRALADLSLMAAREQARLTPAVARTIARGYALLDEPG